MEVATGERRHLLVLAGLLAAAATAIALLMAGPGAPDARAAACSNDVSSPPGAVLTIQGEGLCSDHDESFRVFCAGNVMIDYAFLDPEDTFATKDSGEACSDVQFLVVNGLNGQDRIEVAAFGGTRNVNGGPGNDQLVVRNGVPDVVDCGDGSDAVQADMASLDSVVNCEVADFLPEPVFPIGQVTLSTPPESPTPPVAKKKCKKPKRRSASAAKKCKRRH